MTHTLATLLLALCCLAGLVLVPLGLPGLWVMVAGVVGYGWLTDFRSVGVTTIALVLGLALVGEIVETWLGFRLARRYGGSSRAGWGALVGGIVGAVVGVPVPIIGSVIAGFIGAFAGAGLFEDYRPEGEKQPQRHEPSNSKVAPYHHNSMPSSRVITAPTTLAMPTPLP